MVQFIQENGKKWSEIVKALQNHRTEHMIKNRFKTLTIKLRKKYKDILSEKELLVKFMEENEEIEDGEGQEE
jgi:hypothetical protein